MSERMAELVRHQVTVEQIHEIEDGPVNPMTGHPWSSKHEELTKTRRLLPIYQRADKILKAYRDNDVFILSGEPGSGKSTQVPQLIAYDEYDSGLLVACTQPRRSAATSLAFRVSEELDVTLGHQVGYWTDDEGMTSDASGGKRPKTRILYMTEVLLVKLLQDDPKLSPYACVIVDEAHEPTVYTELLLAMLKNALVARSDHSLKIIIMSATLETGVFKLYFNDAPLLTASDLSNNDYMINKYENEAVGLPVDPIWYGALKQAAILGCLLEMIDIVALCSTKNDVFMRPAEYTIVADEAHRVWKAFQSDHIALLDAFSTYLQVREKYVETEGFNLRQWCQDFFLDIYALEEAIEIRTKLEDQILHSGIELFSTATAISKTKQYLILKALATGMPTQLAIARNLDPIYSTINTSVEVQLPTTSAAVISTRTEWVVYTSSMGTGGTLQLLSVSPVSGEWLVELPFLATENLAKKDDGTLRQAFVKEALDRVRARLATANKD